jgi:hypothetical protein
MLKIQVITADGDVFFSISKGGNMKPVCNVNTETRSPPGTCWDLSVTTRTINLHGAKSQFR